MIANILMGYALVALVFSNVIAFAQAAIDGRIDWRAVVQASVLWPSFVASIIDEWRKG